MNVSAGCCSGLNAGDIRGPNLWCLSRWAGSKLERGMGYLAQLRPNAVSGGSSNLDIRMQLIAERKERRRLSHLRHHAGSVHRDLILTPVLSWHVSHVGTHVVEPTLMRGVC